MKITKTLKFRVKDKHKKVLGQQAKAVNFVWNYINELSSRSIKERGRFLSAFDVHPYTKGANKELGLHSQTLQCVAKEYVTRRKQFKKARLNWRKSGGSKRSLGWIPVNTGAAKWKNGQVYFNGQYFGVWDSYGLSEFTFRTASFNEDARGRWYFNVVVEVEAEQGMGKRAVGIDLGCKQAAMDSNGNGVTGRHYRKLEARLGLAQRARNKRKAKAIHAKIKNRRHDDLHKYSRKLVNENAAIFVGNVNSKALAKTKMAKSVLDAGWGMLKTMLEYKCEHAGIVFEEINEAYTTQTCSCCGIIPASSPKGRAGLGIREWSCSACGATHDRDINAAKNILAVGHGRLAVGIHLL
jgi:putative transposase